MESKMKEEATASDSKYIHRSKTKEQTTTMYSKYIQQHLANERTYLAWVRTAITIMGVGYLAAKLHFFSEMVPSTSGDLLPRFIDLAAIIVGIIIILYATFNYSVKRRGINDQTFIAPSTSHIFLTGGVVTLSFLFLAYLFAV
jgi:putative membrane protein